MVEALTTSQSGLLGQSQVEPTTSIRLTDDEVAALALDAEAFWPAELPTVAITDSADIFAAAMRGQRSLYTRGLLDDEGNLAPAVAELARSCAGSRNTLSVYIGGPDLMRTDAQLASTHYRLGDEWLAEGISPLGVHEFQRFARENQVAYLTAILVEALDTGLPEGAATDGERWYVCVVDVREDAVNIHAARPGEYRTAEIDSDGAISMHAPRAFDPDSFARLISG